jgi:hypothetical protein
MKSSGGNGAGGASAAARRSSKFGEAIRQEKRMGLSEQNIIEMRSSYKPSRQALSPKHAAAGHIKKRPAKDAGLSEGYEIKN